MQVFKILSDVFSLFFFFSGILTWMTIGFNMSIVIDNGLWLRHKATAADVLQSAGIAVMHQHCIPLTLDEFCAGLKN